MTTPTMAGPFCCRACEREYLRLHPDYFGWIVHEIAHCSCRNKRCPRSAHHDHECTGSNDEGQVGSLYGVPCECHPELWRPLGGGENA